MGGLSYGILDVFSRMFSCLFYNYCDKQHPNSHYVLPMHQILDQAVPLSFSKDGLNGPGILSLVMVVNGSDIHRQVIWL